MTARWLFLTARGLYTWLVCIYGPPMQDLIVNQYITIPARELHISTSRASGPGGQHVNTTSSRVTLRFCLSHSQALSSDQKTRIANTLASRLTKNGELLVSCATSRSQHKNQQEACDRLAALLRSGLAVRTPRKKTKPSKASQARRLEQKKARSQTKKLRRTIRDEA